MLTTGCGNRQDSNGSVSGADQKEVIVYGSKTCPHCVHFIRELEKASIAFTFMEVDENDRNFQEMYDKVQAAKIKGYIKYPVVDVGGDILIAPEFEDFKEHL